MDAALLSIRRAAAVSLVIVVQLPNTPCRAPVSILGIACEWKRMIGAQRTPRKPAACS
jgi:hypothetical protein